MFLRMRIAVFFDAEPHSGELDHYAIIGGFDCVSELSICRSLARWDVRLLGSEPDTVQSRALGFCENHLFTSFVGCGVVWCC